MSEIATDVCRDCGVSEWDIIRHECIEHGERDVCFTCGACQHIDPCNYCGSTRHDTSNPTCQL